jgi:hypothetical protein
MGVCLHLMQPGPSLEVAGIWQVYVYVTVDYSTKRNRLNRITVFDRIAESAQAAHIKEPKARLPFPFNLSDQGEFSVLPERV